MNGINNYIFQITQVKLLFHIRININDTYFDLVIVCYGKAFSKCHILRCEPYLSEALILV